MKANYEGHLTSAQRKARDREIRLQIAESVKRFSVAVEATMLWQLHEQEGYGVVRLDRFLEGFKPALDELKAFYELGDVDEMNYACIQNLKAIGFDISKLGSSMPIEYTITDVDEPLPNR